MISFEMKNMLETVLESAKLIIKLPDMKKEILARISQSNVRAIRILLNKTNDLLDK